MGRGGWSKVLRYRTYGMTKEGKKILDSMDCLETEEEVVRPARVSVATLQGPQL